MHTNNPNLLIIVLDSVRLKNTSLCGDKETTPFLKQFADNSSFYPNAWAAATNSVESHVSMFTGKTAPEHGHTTGTQPLDEDTLWDDLRDSGYKTGIFTNNPYLTEMPIGIYNSFDTVKKATTRNYPFVGAADPNLSGGAGLQKYVSFLGSTISSKKPLRSMINGISAKIAGYDGVSYSLRPVSGSIFTDWFTEWARSNENRPWAACVNYMDAHTPFYPKDEYLSVDEEIVSELSESAISQEILRNETNIQTELVEQMYDDSILQADHNVERLIEFLRTSGQMEDTLVVVTADHGEALGETNEFGFTSSGHGFTGGLCESVLRVPLIVSYPDGRSETIEQPVSLLNVYDVAESLPHETKTVEEIDDAHSPTATVFGQGKSLSGLKNTNLDSHKRDGFAVYKRKDSRILKYTRYGNEFHVHDVTDPEKTISISCDDEYVRGIIRNADSSTTQTDGEASNKVDEKTKNRLEELGYL